jgi:hypothetical protein
MRREYYEYTQQDTIKQYYMLHNMLPFEQVVASGFILLYLRNFMTTCDIVCKEFVCIPKKIAPLEYMAGKDTKVVFWRV